MFDSKKEKLLIATTNRKKLKEIQELLAGFPFELLTLSDLPSFQEVPEIGKTFKENATLKAVGYAKQSGFLTLGEDSGLCCDALDGAPGVYSARFAGTDKSDSENNQKLLRLYQTIPDNCRDAHYTSAIAIATADHLIGVVEGEVHGLIYHKLVGDGGFGYDPLFYYPPFKTTFGNVPSDEKHKVSHRFKALTKARLLLEDYLHSQNSSGK